MYAHWLRRGLLAFSLAPAPLAAQTDYYNTDAGRPVLIEDALPVERYAFELQLAPLRLERGRGGAYNWGVEPEVAYGIFPRTQVEVGLPLVYQDGAMGKELGAAGVEMSVLHNLNTETRTLPALALAADLVLPVGSFAPDRVYPSVKGIATRTLSWARFHVNGQYTFGAAPGEESVVPTETSRWLAGVAVDRTFPIRSMLLIADFYASQPMHEDEDIELNAGAGVRYQLSPQFALDGGVGKHLNGDGGWFVTFGTAYAFAVRSLIPGLGR